MNMAEHFQKKGESSELKYFRNLWLQKSGYLSAWKDSEQLSVINLLMGSWNTA